MAFNVSLSLFNNWNFSMFGSEAHAIQAKPQNQAEGYLPAEAYFGMPCDLPTAPAIGYQSGPALPAGEPGGRKVNP